MCMYVRIYIYIYTALYIILYYITLYYIILYYIILYYIILYYIYIYIYYIYYIYILYIHIVLYYYSINTQPSVVPRLDKWTIVGWMSISCQGLIPFHPLHPVYHPPLVPCAAGFLWQFPGKKTTVQWPSWGIPYVQTHPNITFCSQKCIRYHHDAPKYHILVHKNIIKTIPKLFHFIPDGLLVNLP